MLTAGEDRREEENSILNSETDFCTAGLQAEMEEGNADKRQEKKTLLLSTRRA